MTLKIWIKRIWIGCAVFVIVLALLSSCFRALTPWLDRYRTDIEKWFGTMLHQPVHIRHIEAGWYWFEPVLHFEGLEIGDTATNTTIKIQTFLLGLQWWRSLWLHRLQPGFMFIQGLHLNVIQRDGTWLIQGSENTAGDSSAVLQALLPVVLSETLVIRDLDLTLLFQDGRELPLKQVVIQYGPHLGQHQARLTANSSAPWFQQIDLRANMTWNGDAWNTATGHVYVVLEKGNLQALSPWWQGRGQVDFQAWMDIQNGQLRSAQTRIAAQNWQGMIPGFHQSLRFKQLKGDLAWHITKNGWLCRGDHVQIGWESLLDSDNAFSLALDEKQHRWTISLKGLPLKVLRTLPIQYPADLRWIPQAQWRGSLWNTKLVFHQEQPSLEWHWDSLLTEARQVGFQGVPHAPQVKALSAVIYATPERGRLILNSPGLMLDVPKKPAILFEQAYGDVTWKRQQEAWQISLHTLTLQALKTLFQAQGRLTQFGKDPQLSLKGYFKGKEIQHWMPYVVLIPMKPKLARWLQQGIHHIGGAEGYLRVQGALADFPFDVGKGDWSIDSKLEEVDLVFAKDWPLTKGIQGNLRVNNRLLEADITRAYLAPGLLAEHVNLRLPDMGLDKEHLLVRGHDSFSSPLVLKYLAQTPLRSNLSLLLSLEAAGKLDLDLQLDAAMYPGNDTILALGDVTLYHNEIMVRPFPPVSRVQQVEGSFQFDEKGILGGRLHGEFLGDPLQMTLTSVRGQKSYTRLAFFSQLSLHRACQAFSLCLQPWVTGKIPLMLSLDLASGKNAKDQMVLRSNLQGTQIALPKPLGKRPEHKEELQITATRVSQEVVQLTAQYGKPLISEVGLVLTRKNSPWWNIGITQTNCVGNLQYNPETRTIRGALEKLYIPEMTDVSPKHKKTETLHADSLPNLDLTIRDLQWQGWNLGAATLKGERAGQAWKLTQGTLQSPAYRVNLTGDWQGSQSHIDSQIQIMHLGHLLDQWHQYLFFEAGKGQMQLNAHWKGPLYHFNWDTTVGNLAFRIVDGRTGKLTSAAEGQLGFGKLLSILSLQTLPRRLKLDFSDLSQDGYSFDLLDGDFAIRHGVLHTSNTKMDGPVASADISGDINVPSKSFDLSIRIVPHITASLPIVATIAGGPVVGLATWVASKIINGSMQKINSYTYKVTGPWHEPVVKPEKFSVARPKPPEKTAP
ncbi:MAG: AsmA-like C-terminal region-containing protein [Legionellaceae bacterium]|nr:AsmA-like C-terminal region-containing protein [Legionellaceae bacterium]